MNYSPHSCMVYLNSKNLPNTSSSTPQITSNAVRKPPKILTGIHQTPLRIVTKSPIRPVIHPGVCDCIYIHIYIYTHMCIYMHMYTHIFSIIYLFSVLCSVRISTAELIACHDRQGSDRTDACYKNSELATRPIFYVDFESAAEINRILQSEGKS